MTEAKAGPQKEYISNPFVLTFKGLDKLFKINQTPAIIILVVSLFGGMLQFFGNFWGGPSPEPYGTAPAPTTAPAPIAEPSISPVLIVAILVGVLVFVLVSIFINTVVSGFASFVAYKTYKNQTTDFGEAFGEVMKRFWTILSINVIVGLKVLGGYLLFIVPGVRAAMRYNLVLIQMFDETLKTGEAIKRAKWLTKDHLIEVFGMSTAASIVPFIGSILAVGGQSIMYSQLKDLKQSGSSKPKVHWLNYIGFILIGLFALFALGIAALIAALSASK